ncbi:RDD family protein [Ferrimonas marina]|uniref:Uncharacterized membrane protein YckC, RDD family n=1 Tax=Ferrimonas marina TaxID=299255 RepID=A0A1M5RKA1_9GAMM|nr:RDD family protein [Ferrimonas marina]SHH26253.1 Uncharacterized membrane protein YckC, RDD family [Ferrimonas marina]
MDKEIDFSHYSLDDLYSSAESIDRTAFPERAKRIDMLIAEKEQSLPSLESKSSLIGERATRLDRFFAALVDFIIAMIITMIILFGEFLLLGIPAIESSTKVILIETIYTLILGLAIQLTVHGYFLHQYGQTIGKRLLSIRIENLDGTQASFRKIVFVRMLPMHLLTIIQPIGQLIAGIINPLMIFGKQRRCLHDYIAKTKVCYTSTKN